MAPKKTMAYHVPAKKVAKLLINLPTTPAFINPTMEIKIRIKPANSKT